MIWLVRGKQLIDSRVIRVITLLNPCCQCWSCKICMLQPCLHRQCIIQLADSLHMCLLCNSLWLLEPVVHSIQTHMIASWVLTYPISWMLLMLHFRNFFDNSSTASNNTTASFRIRFNIYGLGFWSMFQGLELRVIIALNQQPQQQSSWFVYHLVQCSECHDMLHRRFPCRRNSLSTTPGSMVLSAGPESWCVLLGQLLMYRYGNMWKFRQLPYWFSDIV